MNTKLPTKVRVLIKDLELQIDYLIGYKPSGSHWKMEYHIRKTMLEETLNDPATPQEIIDKIARIQDQLYTFYNKDRHKQGYISYSCYDYMPKPERQHPIKVNFWEDNKQKSILI